MAIPVQGKIGSLGLTSPIWAMKKIVGLGPSIFRTIRRLTLERRERSEADQIVWECKLTDYLQEQIDMTNPQLKNFQLSLKMEPEQYQRQQQVTA